MARKITVLSDFSNDDSLTPEQEQALEVKVDAMLDPEQPESEPEPAPKPKKTATKKKPVSPPPAAKPKTIVPVVMAADPPGVTVQETTNLDPAPAVIEPTDKIIDEPELPVAEAAFSTRQDRVAGAPPLPPAGASDKDQESQPNVNPEPVAELKPEPLVKPTPVTAPSQSATEPAEDETAKKYRPPDGPLPFKRAESNDEILETGSGDDHLARQASHQLNSEAAVDDHKTSTNRPVATAQRRKKSRHIGFKILLAVFGLLVVAALLPASRVAILNLVHVRSSVKVKVVDNVTHAPLSDVTVSIGAAKAVTDQSGQATIANLRLGSRTITFQKPGFEPSSQTEFIDRQPVAASDVTLTANGRQYILNVVDSVSQQLLPMAKAAAGSFTATGDATGRILLTVGVNSTVKTATVTAAGYQPLAVNLPVNATSPQTVQLVPGGSDFYTTTASGSSGVYQVGVDGQNSRLLLPATGNESGSMTLVPDAHGAQLAVISTRDKQKDQAGYLLNTLTIVQVGARTNMTVDHAKQIKIVGWYGKRLLYTNLQADTTVNDPQRYKLLSYDTATKKTQTIATTNTFNDIVTAAGYIYYAATGTDNTAQLVRIKPDGSDKQPLLTKAVSTIIRNDYSQLLFMATDGYYAAALNDRKPTAVTNTYSGSSRLYVDNLTGSRSAWINQATSQLMVHHKSGSRDQVIASGMGITYPLRWINDTTLLYRKATSDYVISTAGGSGQKVVTVGASGGLAAWQN